jgi:hypothetical protein
MKRKQNQTKQATHDDKTRSPGTRGKVECNDKKTLFLETFGEPKWPKNGDKMLFLGNPGTEENQGNPMSRKSGFPQQENTDLGVIFGALRDQKGAKRQSKSVG